MSVHRQPLFENWVFYAWGAILIAGAALHFAVSRRLTWTPMNEFLRLWVPLICIGLTLESTAYVLNAKRAGLPFWSRDFARVASALVGGTAVIVFLVVVLFDAGVGQLVPDVLLLGFAILMFLFGQHPSYGHLNYLAYFALAAAVVLYLFHPDSAVSGLLCGIVAGVSMIVAGVVGGRTVHTV